MVFWQIRNFDISEGEEEARSLFFFVLERGLPEISFFRLPKSISRKGKITIKERGLGGGGGGEENISLPQGLLGCSLQQA